MWFFNRKLRYCKTIETTKNEFVHYQSTIVKKKRQRNHGVGEVKKRIKYHIEKNKTSNEEDTF